MSNFSVAMTGGGPSHEYSLEMTGGGNEHDYSVRFKIPTAPDEIQKIAASGKAGDVYRVGDEIVIPYTRKTYGNNPVETEYQWPFVVAHIGDCVDDNGIVHHNAIWLIGKNSGPQDMMYSLNNHEEWNISDMREWLNSDADISDGVPGNGTWWTEKVPGDVAAFDIPKIAGFMHGFTEEWLNIFKPVRVKTHTDKLGEEFVVTHDKFFLPSTFQMNGFVGSYLYTVESYDEPFDYFKIGVDTTKNKNDAGYSPNRVDIRKINELDDTTPQDIMLRNRTYYTNWFEIGVLNATTGAIKNNSYGATVSSILAVLPVTVIY